MPNWRNGWRSCPKRTQKTVHLGAAKNGGWGDFLSTGVSVPTAYTYITNSVLKLILRCPSRRNVPWERQLNHNCENTWTNPEYGYFLCSVIDHDPICSAAGSFLFYNYNFLIYFIPPPLPLFLLQIQGSPFHTPDGCVPFEVNSFCGARLWCLVFSCPLQNRSPKPKIPSEYIFSDFILLVTSACVQVNQKFIFLLFVSRHW